jgi:hypothetical protein
MQFKILYIKRGYGRQKIVQNVGCETWATEVRFPTDVGIFLSPPRPDNRGLFLWR